MQIKNKYYKLLLWIQIIMRSSAKLQRAACWSGLQGKSTGLRTNNDFSKYEACTLVYRLTVSLR
jgi:hypothetical protein